MKLFVYRWHRKGSVCSSELFLLSLINSLYTDKTEVYSDVMFKFKLECFIWALGLEFNHLSFWLEISYWILTTFIYTYLDTVYNVKLNKESTTTLWDCSSCIRQIHDSRSDRFDVNVIKVIMKLLIGYSGSSEIQIVYLCFHQHWFL